MVQSLAVIIVVYVFILPGTQHASAWCTDSMLVNSLGYAEAYDVDTTGHWWALLRPYSQFQQLVVDGHDFGMWDIVDVPVFSFDGSTWATRAVRSGQWVIVTAHGNHPSALPIDQVYYPPQSAELWWIEREGTVSRITNGTRSYTTTYPIAKFLMDPGGMVVTWQESRPGNEVIMQNGTEVARGSDIRMWGVWADGRCVYTQTLGVETSVMLDQTELTSGLRQVPFVTLNPFGTVMAWQGVDGASQVHTYVFSDEFENPWEGPVTQELDQRLALSPHDALVAYRTTRLGSRVVGYNGAFYPRGTIASPPVFSHDGAVMAYASQDNGDYVVVDGKRIPVKAGVPTTDVIAVSPSGASVAWCSSTTLVVVDLEFNRLTLGKMCDKVGRAVYDRKEGVYKTLGEMSGRLYLLTCDAR